MKPEEKIIEILFKMINDNYTEYDQLKDLSIALNKIFGTI